MTRVLVLNAASPTSSSGYLFEALAEALREAGHDAHAVHTRDRGGLKGQVHALLPLARDRRRHLARAEVVVVHTSVIFNAVDILWAKLRGARVMAIYWDSYPESFEVLGARQNRIKSWIIGAVERSILRLCDRILPPSADYVPHIRSLFPKADVRVLKMWPFSPVCDPTPASTEDEAVHVVFTGAVNIIRGLDHAIDLLSRQSTRPVVIHTYGHDAPAFPGLDAMDKVRHEHHGFVPQEQINAKLAAYDFGLVSLHPDFPLPAFPSKTLSYLCAGLPILYAGPSLPDYEAEIADLGIGLTLRDDGAVDLKQVSRDLRGAFGDNQRKALAHYELNEVALDQVL